MEVLPHWDDPLRACRDGWEEVEWGDRVGCCMGEGSGVGVREGGCVQMWLGLLSGSLLADAWAAGPLLPTPAPHPLSLPSFPPSQSLRTATPGPWASYSTPQGPFPVYKAKVVTVPTPKHPKD